MALIPLIREHEASGKVKEIFDDIKAHIPQVVE